MSISVSHFNVHVVNAIVCYVCVIYTALVSENVSVKCCSICYSIERKVEFQGGLRAIVSIGLIHAVILLMSIVSIASLGVYHVGLKEIWDRSVVGGRIVPPE